MTMMMNAAYQGSLPLLLPARAGGPADSDGDAVRLLLDRHLDPGRFVPPKTCLDGRRESVGSLGGEHEHPMCAGRDPILAEWAPHPERPVRLDVPGGVRPVRDGLQ